MTETWLYMNLPDNSVVSAHCFWRVANALSKRTLYDYM